MYRIVIVLCAGLQQEYVNIPEGSIRERRK